MSINRHILHCLTLALTAIIMQALPCHSQDIADSLKAIGDDG